jgi:long-chain fatty acid transport protein
MVATATLTLSSSLYASGFSIFEQGAKASAMAGAYTATADDPSAMFYNVAGIAYQRNMAAYAGATMITFRNEFRGSAETFPGSGTAAQFEDHIFVIPNVYAVIPVGENATIGFGQFSAFGLRTDWEEGNTWSGRFISQDANLKTVSLQPSFAMKTSNGKFAWGVGAEYRTSHISLERNNAAINPFTQRIADVAHIRLDSEWSDGWGYNVGLMFRPSDTFSVGFQYRAPIDIDYKGDADFQQILTGNPQFDGLVASQLPPDQNIETSIDFPGFYSLGVATTAIPNWTIGLDAVYTDWSRFERLEVEFQDTPAANLNIEQNWDNSYSIRLGGNRAVTDRWDVRLGALYDTTPQPVDVVGPLLPDNNRAAVTFGLGWHSDHFKVDVSNMVLMFEDRDTFDHNHDNFNGVYKTQGNLLSLNLGYTF